MKMITAIVQPFMLSKVVSALEALANFPGMTVTDARGFGSKRSAHEARAAHFDDFHPKTRLEIVAPDAQTDLIVQTILRHAHTGHDGDGKVFVWEVAAAARIQTGARDEAAL